MPTWLIIVLAVLAILAIGGFFARRMYLKRTEADFRAKLEQAVGAERHHLFHRLGLDAVYIDLPLETPATALVADDLERLGISYAGVFPNHRTDGDVLRLQSLHRVRVKADDVAVASDHGRELLDYILGDLPAEKKAT